MCGYSFENNLLHSKLFLLEFLISLYFSLVENENHCDFVKLREMIVRWVCSCAEELYEFWYLKNLQFNLIIHRMIIGAEMPSNHSELRDRAYARKREYYNDLVIGRLGERRTLGQWQEWNVPIDHFHTWRHIIIIIPLY